jgi:3-oxoacyl-[acyl-carrier protein] reductase
LSRNTGRLAGKVAIITGASTGCGPVMAKLFVEQGAKVVMAARREELVTAAAKEIGKGAIGIRCDVTNEADVATMVDRAMVEFGQVDIMLNNAAAPGIDKWVWEQTVENFNATIAIDLTAAMLCSREVLNRSMLERGTGVIINFSSTAGWMGMVRKTHYTSAKAALRALTKTIALEVGPKGIRCNCLVPGSIETELWMNWGKRMAAEANLSYEDWKAKVLEGSPLRAIAQPIDIAHLALFLASDESRMITGQSINCDAGGYMVG